MKKRIVFLAVLIPFLWTVSCNSGSSPFSPVTRDLLSPSGLRLTVSASGQGAGSLTFFIEIRNEGGQQVNLDFGSAQVFDIVVKDSSGTTVWQWAYDKYFSALVWRLELTPGQSYSQEAIWDLTGNDKRPLPSGSYKARVNITNYPRDSGLVIDLSVKL